MASYAPFHRMPWGSVPNTSGRIFWVAPTDGYTINGEVFRASDDNDGLSPERALRTIDRAWNLVIAYSGDAIVLIPNGSSTGHIVQTTSVAADVAGVSMFGMAAGQGNPLKNKTTVTTDITADQIINVTAPDIEFGYFDIIPITAADGIDLSAAADGFYIHDFKIDMKTPAVSTSTRGIRAIGAAENVLLEDFSVICDGAQGEALIATALIDSVIRRGIMLQSAGTWAVAIGCGAATTQLHIDDVRFLPSAATMTAGINGAGATIASGVLVTNCMFADSVTVAIDNFDAGECEIAENYQLGVGSTDGGVLITAIT